jgi:hypothetical protein
MGFSTSTMKSVNAVADMAKAMWTGAKVSVGFGWDTLIQLLLGLVMQMCQPKTPEARSALIKSLAAKCSSNGIDGCIDACMGGQRADKVHRKMEKRLKLKTSAQRDAHFHNAIMAANAVKAVAIKGMGNAFDKNESDDD